jgi:hypothetical protein
MEYVIIFGFIILSCGLISWSWVKGIDYMKENHPDYKGDDFLNWGNEKIDDEFSRQALANQPERMGEKPKTQTDYAKEHSVREILSDPSKEKIVEEIKSKGLYSVKEFRKSNPKQFDGIKSDEPFVKTRKKKKRNWENEIDLGGSE